MSCGREMTASIKPYSTASSAPMKKSLSVSCTTPSIRASVAGLRRYWRTCKQVCARRKNCSLCSVGRVQRQEDYHTTAIRAKLQSKPGTCSVRQLMRTIKIT